jgi:hypothetical protein
MSSGLRMLIAALLVGGCGIQVEANGQFSCPDGRCPIGLFCVDGACRPPPSTTPDAGLDAGLDADLPDAAADAALPGVCNDGIKNEGEECDDGDGINTNSCTNACKYAFCGDFILWGGVDDCNPAEVVNCTVRCYQCPAGAIDLDNGHCYGPVPTAAGDFASAVAACETLVGSHLLVPDETGELIGLDMLNPTVETWIGLIDPDRWLTGMPTGDIPWRAGQPTAPPSPDRPVIAKVPAPHTLMVAPSAAGPHPGVCEIEPWLTSPIDNHAYVIDWKLAADGAAAEARCATVDAPLVTLQGGTLQERHWLRTWLAPGRYCVEDVGGPGTCRTLVVDGPTAPTQLVPGCSQCRPLCEHD